MGGARSRLQFCFVSQVFNPPLRFGSLEDSDFGYCFSKMRPNIFNPQGLQLKKSEGNPLLLPPPLPSTPLIAAVGT